MLRTNLCKLLPWLLVAAPSLSSAADISIDVRKRFQTIDGFGACLIRWDGRIAACYGRPQVQRIFAEDLRLNMLRCNIWGDGTIGEMPAEQISYKDPAFAAQDRRTLVFITFARAIRRSTRT